MLKDDVLNKIKDAEAGRELWLSLVEKHSIKDGEYVVLFPGAYDDWAYYGALYLDDFLKFKASGRALALCFDDEVRRCVASLSQKSEILEFSREDAERLIAFYSLYMFTDSLIILSPDKPAGRNGTGIVGVKGVTVEEIVAIGIYGIKELKTADE